MSGMRIEDPLARESSQIFEIIDDCVHQQRVAEAARRLEELWRTQPGPASAAFVNSRFARLRGTVPLVRYRLAIQRSFTVEPLADMLRAACYVAGIELEIHIGQFNAYVQEILDPDGRLYRFRPDAVILAVQTRDIAAKLWTNFSELRDQQAADLASGVVEDFRTWIRALRMRSDAHLVLHNLEEPRELSYGIADNLSPLGQASYVRRINTELRSMAGEFRGVYLLDYDALVARHGRFHWYDERKWIAARLPMAAPQLIHLIDEWMRFLHPMTGRISKALAVDLDDTLWGGVLGEVGVQGIRVGAEDSGAAFMAVQRALLDLRARGVLLCLCSKNNSEEALAAIENHPGMLLRTHHFSAVRINWEDKAHNLRELAAELNIGTDALAFLDDNVVEREHVRMEMPEVHVIELPGNPASYADALRASPVFERLFLSQEDRERPAHYESERERSHLLGGSPNREDFLRSLKQCVRILPIDDATLGRAVQLTQKTNQFNLTTRRYTAQQLAELTNRSEWQVLALQVRDRFGDSGFVGLAMVRHDDGISELDTFLLSCRVIGRTIETALLARVAEEASGRGSERLRGWFFPTKSNQPAGGFYALHGFSMVSQDERGSLWSIDLTTKPIAWPEWIQDESTIQEARRLEHPIGS
jgi:FkbH-like protein